MPSSFSNHIFTNDIKMQDLSNYPWVHFIIPKLDSNSQRALTHEINKLDKDALVYFIDMHEQTSLLVFKHRTKKLRSLLGKHAEVERLNIPVKKGNARGNNLEEMLQKRCKIGRERYANFWLEPTKSE